MMVLIDTLLVIHIPNNCEFISLAFTFTDSKVISFEQYKNILLKFSTS